MIARICMVSILIFAAGDAWAQSVGRVLIAVGDVAAYRAGREVALVTGASIENGDVVRTGEASSAQLRFNDESVVSMRAKTRFSVTDFRFTGADDGVSSAAFNLLQGGIRTLTGLIGRTQRDRYRLSAQLATVGIRGTAYTLVLCQQDCFESEGVPAADGAYGVVFDGRIAVTNEGGSVEFGVEEAFFVSDLRTPAQPLLTRPGFLRDRLEARSRREQQMREAAEARREQMQASAREASAREAAAREAAMRAAVADAKGSGSASQSDLRVVATLGTAASPIVAVADQRDASGNIALVGPGLGAGVGFSTASVPIALVDGGTGTVISVDRERGFLDGFSFNAGDQAGDRQNAAVLDGGNIAGDGGAAWGRWTPGAAVSIGGSVAVPSTGVHFFYGNLTPESLFGTLPSGATAVRYEYAGGPRPTDERGQPGQFLSGNFIVNFVQRTLGGELLYKVDTTAYRLPIPDGTALVAGRGFVGFFATGRNAGQWQCSCNNTSGTIDNYSVSGIFLGSRAQGLGVNFATVDAVAGRTAGAAVFKCVSGGCK